MMGFDGTEVSPEIKQLITKHRLGKILLKAQNLKCIPPSLPRNTFLNFETAAKQATKLVLDLQSIAHNAGHPVPLAIALDQENGGVNSLFDPEFIQQFPSAMGTAATGSTEMAYDIAKATAEELVAVGVNWIMGPCLDVLANIKSQPLGVRSMGDEAGEVSQYGKAFISGYEDGGLATSGKHFPSYGNLEFLGTSWDVPMITDSLEDLSLAALKPFRNAIKNGIDSLMVGGCAMSSEGVEAMHACLSNQVVDDLLRKKMHFDGVVVSECLELDALRNNMGVSGGTVMAVQAGCDMILVCHSSAGQQEAFKGLRTGLENGILTRERIQQSFNRVLRMKAKYMTWEKTLSPGGIDALALLQPSHAELSRKAYDSSIVVARDKDRLLPLSQLLDSDEELLLLTPLVKPLPASAASQQAAQNPSTKPPLWHKNASGMGGESVFRELGRSLARERGGRVLHTSYTANGLRPVHENFINRASAVVVITADANRNLYQHAFTKHVAMLCKLSQVGERHEKPLVVVSVSSPYDFAMDSSIGTYVCTFDFTETALQSLVDVLFGELSPTGALPGSLRQNQKVHQAKQHWLVEQFEDQDRDGLDSLLANMKGECPVNERSVLAGCTSDTFLLENDNIIESHFVVRNSSTQAVYGFCSTYYFTYTKTGVLGPILVDPHRRNLSIGHSLHQRAIKALLRHDGIKRLQLGSRLPSIYLGIPSTNNLERKRLRQWFTNMGWNTPMSRPVCSMLLPALEQWAFPESMVQRSMKHSGIVFDQVQGFENAEPILDLLKTSSRQGIQAVYALALKDPLGCAIMRAKRQKDGALLGAVVLYTEQSAWSHAVPMLKDSDGIIGGISSPIISPSAGEYSTLLQSLILLGIRQHQVQNSTAVFFDCVSSGTWDRTSLHLANAN